MAPRVLEATTWTPGWNQSLQPWPNHLGSQHPPPEHQMPPEFDAQKMTVASHLSSFDISWGLFRFVWTSIAVAKHCGTCDVYSVYFHLRMFLQTQRDTVIYIYVCVGVYVLQSQFSPIRLINMTEPVYTIIHQPVHLESCTLIAKRQHSKTQNSRE